MSLTIDLRRPDAVHVFFNKTARVWWDGVFQIIEAGGDVNGEKYGITIMTRAANEGNAEAVRRLLRYGAHTQKASQAKDTPLMIAAEHGHVECVDAFMSLARDQGIIPALESSHAVAHAIKLAKTLPKTETILVNLSGRGDKDVDYVVENFGAKYGVSVPKYEMPKAEAALSAA